MAKYVICWTLPRTYGSFYLGGYGTFGGRFRDFETSRAPRHVPTFLLSSSFEKLSSGKLQENNVKSGDPRA